MREPQMDVVNKNESIDLGAEKRKEIINMMKPMFEQELNSLNFSTKKEDGKYCMEDSIRNLRSSVDALEKLIKETL